MKQIAIFTSGTSRGSNFKAIVDSVKKQSLPIEIAFLLVTNQESPIVNIANENNIKVIVYDKSYSLNDFIIDTLENYRLDLIVLAGFMRKLNHDFFSIIKIPVINIHPALLPKYGGKGMFGIAVHRAVFANKETFSGATVHFVNEDYDTGEIIMQKKCDISACKSADEIAGKILKLEHELYIKAISLLLFTPRD